jgi:hypothetical protein
MQVCFSVLVFFAFTPDVFPQKDWDSEDKSGKPNNHAGFKPTGD